MNISSNKRKRDYDDDNDDNSRKRERLEQSIFTIIYLKRFIPINEI